jgi:DNA helicase-2/ATP-dependent DNA helicase PcrA
MLPKAKIPYETTSGIGYFAQAHIKDILALLRVAEFPEDYLSFSRLLSLFPGMGEATVEKIWHKLGSTFAARSPEHRQLLTSLVPAKAAPQWRPVADALAKYADGDSTAAAYIAEFANKFYRAHLAKEYENHDEREDDIKSLATEIERGGNVREFLGEIALLTNVDRARDDAEPRVILSTIHQSKGLEWPVVIMLSVVEGMFPSPRSTEEDGDAEERRLFYVAVTRAKEQLHLLTPKMRNTYDGGIYECDPSRFIREIPKHLFRFESPTRYSAFSQAYQPKRW